MALAGDSGEVEIWDVLSAPASAKLNHLGAIFRPHLVLCAEEQKWFSLRHYSQSLTEVRVITAREIEKFPLTRQLEIQKALVRL
jgi:hypothetical protein